MWPPNSSDLNPVDYAIWSVIHWHIWSVIQQRVYETRVHDIDELRQRPAACLARLVVAVAEWWRNWPMANALVCLCLCQWRTFWTYFVTINLFSLYLMNFMFHTMLDAACNILRVHNKSIKCDVSFSLGSVSMLFKWGGHLCHVCVKHFLLLTTGQKL